MNRIEINHINEIPKAFLLELTIHEKYILAKQFCHAGNFKNYSIWQNTESAKGLFKTVVRLGSVYERKQAMKYIEESCSSDFLIYMRLVMEVVSGGTSSSVTDLLLIEKE